MKIKIIKDSTDIFPHLYEGSVIHDVRKTKIGLEGIFASSFGSYYITIPMIFLKDRCELLNQSISQNKNS